MEVDGELVEDVRRWFGGSEGGRERQTRVRRRGGPGKR